ncbi:recombinase family protein [Escherichia coli]|nr:recombinase family protein [Escherichia coli]
MKRVISYIRFSSEKQAKGDSLRRQSKMVTDWLKAHPEYYLDQDLSFRDLGVSGFTGKHLKGGLGDFLTAIEKGLVKAGDTLLIESLDRLSRQAAYFHERRSLNNFHRDRVITFEQIAE